VSYRVEVSSLAKRELRALPGHVRAQALQLLRSLAVDPRPAQSKELRGKSNIYRVWLAKNWRVVYALEDEIALVLIIRIRRKEHIDYDSL